MITFREFMQRALYDPDRGYYNTERLKIGPRGDYYTSSNVHPAFGAVLARALIDLSEKAFGSPSLTSSSSPLTLLELGAGTGQLAYDVLSAIRAEQPLAFPRLDYVIVETSPAMRARQQEKLTDFRDRVHWADLAELERRPIHAIAFSNELVDAMPVHRVRWMDGEIEELYVAPDEREGLGVQAESEDRAKRRSIWGKASTPRLAEYAARAGADFAQGQMFEINLAAVDWLEQMSYVLARGFLLTIDYGDVATHLYGPDRMAGTLRAFHHHRLADSPLELPGEQDITASVNFTALIEYGRDFGFELVSYERQTAFLLRMGLIDRIAAMEGADGTVDDLKQRLAIKNLFVPGGVSDNFRVLIQRR